MRLSSGFAFVLTLFIAVTSASAHQPVMDMAPRWEDGFGFQIRNETRVTDDLKNRDDHASNPFGRERLVNTTWIEGIYTFKRELRATVKIPWIVQRRDVIRGGVRTRLSGSGLGDVILAVPMRKYWNFRKSTMNIGLTPQVRIPTGSTSESDPLGDGSWDFGLSASVSSENFRWYTLFDLFWWKNTDGVRNIDQGDQVGLDANVGYHVYHDNDKNWGAFVMVDMEARYEEAGRDVGGRTGGTRLTLGPVLVGYWDNWMLRADVKLPVYERVFGTQFARGPVVNVGLGVTF